MTDNILIPILIIIGGAIVSVILYIVLYKSSNKLLKMFQLYPESQDILKIALRFIASFICILVFLIFLRVALRIIGLTFTAAFIEGILVSSGKYFSAFLVVVMGFYISKRINENIKGINVRFKHYIYFLSNLVVNTAFVLTGLTIVGIDITVFLEVYKIILLTIGITLALIIGIPVGTYVSNKINNKKRKTKIK